MTFDPFGVEKYHEDVRNRISGGKPGLAQSQVKDVLVSYEVGRSVTHGPVLDLSMGQILDEMILDIARGEGVAGPKTFLKSRIQFAIDDRREFPPHWVKKHKEAADIEDFYVNGAGKQMVR